MKIQIENERKFRAIKGPIGGLTDGAEIVQWYVCVKPAIRVRVENFRDSFLTIKIKLAPGVNLELEGKIPFFLRKGLVRFQKHRKVRKTRHKIGRLEIDVFSWELEGLVLIEFEQKFSGEHFEIPVNFLVKEVTGDARFSNHNLCQLDKIPERWRCQDVSRGL